MIAGTLAATATDASAQRRHGWGPPFRGIIAGSIITGAILASRPRAMCLRRLRPADHGPGCYWASQPVYDRWAMWWLQRPAGADLPSGRY